MPSLKIQMERELAAVRRAAQDLRAFLTENRCREKDIWACELALVEACNNAVQHGTSKTPIEIEASLNRGELQIQINDQGSAFEMPAKAELPSENSERGRGLFLIQSLMDEVRCELNGATSCLVLRKAVAPTDQSEIPS